MRLITDGWKEKNPKNGNAVPRSGVYTVYK
jgi:hypothetical protein